MKGWETRECLCCGGAVLWPVGYDYVARARCDFCRMQCRLDRFKSPPYIHKEAS